MDAHKYTFHFEGDKGYMHDEQHVFHSFNAAFASAERIRLEIQAMVFESVRITGIFEI